jgi:hypothetical protein
VAPWIAVWLVVSALTLVFLVAFGVSLARQVLLVGRTARRLGEEAAPLADEISREAGRASDRAAHVQPPRTGRRPGRG